MTEQASLPRSRRSGVARLWRGWTVALLAVLLAAGGHQVAHLISHGMTETLPWELLGFSAALTAPVAVALAGRGPSTWATGLTTIFGQLAFHTLYSLPYTGASALSGGHHHGHHTVPLTEAATAVPQVNDSMMAADTTMLAAHVLAATVTTWIIVHGERSLITLVAWLLLVPAQVVLATLPVRTARPKSVLPAGRVWIPHPMNIVSTRWSRGPPVLA